MAVTLTHSAGDTVRPYRNCKIRHFPETTSQTFKKGEPVILVTGGTAQSRPRIGVASNQPTTLIVGIAAADASGTTDAMCPVWLAKPDAEFQLVYKAAQASAFADFGTGLAILKEGTTNIWYVDNTDTTHDAVVPIEMKPPYVLGDIGGYVIVRFAFAATIYAATV
jgi:hypothetical protein